MKKICSRALVNGAVLYMLADDAHKIASAAVLVTRGLVGTFAPNIRLVDARPDTPDNVAEALRWLVTEIREELGR